MAALGALSLVDSSGAKLLGSGIGIQSLDTGGGAPELKKMSPLDSMKMVFLDIRDGVDKLSKTFSDKISGLNEHLAFRLDKLNTTMTLIGKIATKDLSLEQVQTNIGKNTFAELQEQEDEDERQKSLAAKGGDKDKKQGLFTPGFMKVLDKVNPKNLGDFGMTALVAGGVALAFAVVPFIEKKIEQVAFVVGEYLIPGIKAIGAGFKRYSDEIIENYDSFKKGMVKTFDIAKSGFKDIVEGFKEGDFEKQKKGLKKIFKDGTVQAISSVGEFSVGLLDGIAKGFGYEGDFFENSQQWFRDLPKNIDGYVDNIVTFYNDEVLPRFNEVLNDVKKVYNKDGFVAATKVGAKGIFDNTLALAGNYIADAAGAVADHYGEEEVGKKLKALDFSSDKFMETIRDLGKMIYDPETGSILGMDFPNLSRLLPRLSEIAESIVASLPKWMRPDTLKEKIADKKKEIAFQRAQIAEGDNFDGLGTRRTDILGKLNDEAAALQVEYNQTFGDSASTSTGSIVASSNGGAAIVQSKALKTALSQSTKDGPAGGATTIVDAKNIKGGDNISSYSENIYPGIGIENGDAQTRAIENAMGTASSN